MKIFKLSCVLGLYISLFSISLASSAKLPSVLTCTSNAKASRNYGFIEKFWMGPIPKFGKKPDTSRPFNIATKARKKKYVILRDKVFSGLDTSKPIILSITPESGTLIKAESVEFKGTVINRVDNVAFILWTNPYGNKVWLAAVDLKYRKVTLSQVARGITSIEAHVETLDCR